MNTRYHFITLILFLALSNNASAEFRIWTSVDGTQQINAEFVRTKGSLVELKLENGSTTTIPLKRFSREDRVYIRDAQKKENGAELKPGEETNETNSADTSVAQSDQSQEGTASRSELARLASDELAETSMKLAQQSGMSTQHGLPVIFLDHFVDLENLPVRERTNRYKTAEQSFETQQRDFGKFLERVAIGLDETCLDEYLPTFITYHFPKEVATKLVDSKFQTGGAVGIWKGRNEFERRASKEQFEKEHRKELDNLAVKTPFRICFISEASLSSYDFTRKGLVVGAKNKGGEARVPGYTWKEAIPYLPSAGYYRKKLNIANMPVFGSAFWPVSPEVVAKLPSRSRKNPIGSERITRWAYVATVVSFHSPRLLTRSEREMPTLVGEVESVGLYAEPTLKTHLYDFDLKAYPRPVLAGGAPSSDETSVIPPPFDEFALAGLLVGNDDLQLHEQVWRDLWNHTAMVDQKRYGAIEDQIKKRYDQINGHAVQVNSENRSEREEEYANNLRHEIDEKTAEIDRELHPDRQPFFPPFVSETGGRSWEVDQDILNPERTEAMTSWLAERGDRLKQQFRLTLELTLNPKTEEPTVSSLSMSPEMIQRLKEEDLSPDEIIALDENLQFDQIGELEPEGTRTGLFRTPGSQYRPYQFLLNTGTSAEVLARQLPSEVIKSALSQKPGESRLAVFLDVQIKEMKFLDGPSGFGTEPHRPVVLFEAIPTRLSAGEYNQPPLFESELSTKGLQKAAANKPVKPIPNNADDDRPALPMTPQNLMPLMIKANPELLKDAEFVDQLMVMRWRFENVGMFDVTPDGVHFFDKGSNAVPDTSRRSERADEFKAWLKKWADAIPDQFVWHLDSSDFRFEGPIKDHPSPAVLNGSQHSHWMGGVNAPQLWHVTYALTDEERLPANMSAEAAQQLLEQFAVPSPFVCLDTQFAIPNLKGETHSPFPQNVNSIPGLPAPKYIEPVFPVLQMDKEIWPQADATLNPSSQKPQLEIIGEISSMKIEEKLPPHHWIEAFWKFQGSDVPQDRLQDNGRYAVIPLKLKSARLFDPMNGNTVLSLELKDHRELKDTSSGESERD